MLRKIVKPVGGMFLGWSMLSSGSAEAQTAAHAATHAAPAAAPAAAPVTLGAPVSAPAATTGYAQPGSDPSCFAMPAECAPGVWFNIDYLVWWIKDAPAPGPLVTTGSLLDPLPGALGQPNTQVVFGDQPIGNNAFSGVRLAAGTWIDEVRSLGYEASGFTLEHRTNFQSVASDPTGAPFLARPFFNVQTNSEDIISLATPGFQAGGLSAASSTRFSGWDFNVAVNGNDTGDFRADALFGFRCVYLSESLTIRDAVTALVDQGIDPAALRAGERMATQDRFGTSSNFYGGQIGGRLTWVSDRWINTATVKIALGVTDQLAILEGLATTRGTNGGFGTPIGSGILVYPGNAGRYYQNEFTVVPEFNLNVGYRVTQYVTVRAGYTFLYWSDVVRPGNVVSRSVNPGLNPNLIGFGTGPTGAPRAAIDTSDFWAQGLNLGLEFRF
jgi:hypothetical protein